jgi:hypothetical protein
MKQSGRAAGKANPVVNFPIWSKDQQSLLRKILPSILFTDIEEENKAYLKRSILFSEEGITVKYSGYQLNQKDFDVWMFLVRGARKTLRDYECNLDTSNVLELGQESHLESCIEHLIAGTVEVRNGKYTYCSGLVSSFFKDKVTKDQQITLNSDFVKLFKEYESDADEITS